MTIYIISRDVYNRDGELCGSHDICVTTNKVQADACYERMMKSKYWREICYDEYEDGEEYED